MSPSEFHVRRATVDDLPWLRHLWQAERFDCHELERRFTEFQVVHNSRGELLGTLGLHIDGHQGLLHCEAYLRPETEEALRPYLWERLEGVARNHGLHRLWTREKAPFWRQCGLQPPTEEELAKLPASFGDRHAEWLTLQLRDERAATTSLEQEFELFKAHQDAELARARQQARLIKLVAVGIGLVLFGVLAVFLFKFVKVWPRLRRR
jgi:N-acetylglutamate synthase-like GNAT family acetyltransferase